MVKRVINLPPAWLLVLIGLLLNIAAILLTSVVLESLGKENNQLSKQQADNVYAIQLAWDSVEALERKRETLLLHLHLGESTTLPSSVEHVLRGDLSAWAGQSVDLITLDSLSELMNTINRAQAKHRDDIDTYYLENLELANSMTDLEETMSWYKSVALFLQVFGLALLLARDLARNP